MTNTLTEGSFFVDAVDPATLTRLTPPLPADATALSSLVGALIGPAAAPRVIAAYAQAAINESRSSAAGDLWIEIYGDFILRQATVAYAGRNAASGANLRYGTYAHSIKAPGRGVPHCAELPLLFGTCALDYYKLKVGDADAETQLSAALSGGLMSFTRGEDIVFDGSATWPLFAGVSTPTAALIGAGDGSATSIGYIPKLNQLNVWSQG
jgi:para-nitrobenzyl esterase